MLGLGNPLLVGLKRKPTGKPIVLGGPRRGRGFLMSESPWKSN